MNVGALHSEGDVLVGAHSDKVDGAPANSAISQTSDDVDPSLHLYENVDMINVDDNYVYYDEEEDDGQSNAWLMLLEFL